MRRGRGGPTRVLRGLGLMMAVALFATAPLFAPIVFDRFRGTDPTDLGTPTTGLQQASVRRGDLESSVEMRGRVEVARSAAVTAPNGATITRVLVQEGASVTPGQLLATWRSDGVAGGLRSPLAGLVYLRSVDSGGQVSADQPAFWVSSHERLIVSPLDPASLYSLPEHPQFIRASIVGGPGPFTCSFVSRTTVVGTLTDGREQTPVVFKCKVPPGVRAIAGAPALLTILVAERKDVLLMPRSAIVGETGPGTDSTIFVVGSGGKPDPRIVRIGVGGPNDVEIVSGVVEGERFFYPAALVNLETG